MVIWNGCDRVKFMVIHGLSTKNLLVLKVSRVAGWVGNGVAGMMKLYEITNVMKWIIPENSLRKTHQ